MANLVPHARRYNPPGAYPNSTADRPSSSYNPAPPQAPHVPQRPTSAYTPPPFYPSTSSNSPQAYAQPPINQLNGLSLDSDASRYSDEYRRNVASSSNGGGGGQPRYQLRDDPGYAAPVARSYQQNSVGPRPWCETIWSETKHKIRVV